MPKMTRSTNGGEVSRKEAGQQRKADKAASQKAKVAAQEEAEEARKWEEGSKAKTKPSKKAEDAEAKKAENERKKAERKALLEQETASLQDKSANRHRSANRKYKEPTRTLDLSQVEENLGVTGLNATGIDDALDALALTGSSNNDNVEKHPERRFRSAYLEFQELRLPGIEKTHPHLRRNQRVEICKKEFEKHPTNPFNQASIRYNATKEDVAAYKASERQKIEDRLGR